MASRHAPLGGLGLSELAAPQCHAPRPGQAGLVGLLIPGGGLIANGSLWWGSGLLVVAAVMLRLTGAAALELVVIGVGAGAAALQAAVRRGADGGLPGAGAVFLVAVVPGAVFMAVLGVVGGVAGVGQLANRTYLRGACFVAIQFALSRWPAVAGASWLALVAVPLAAAAEAVWSAWLETPSKTATTDSTWEEPHV